MKSKINYLHAILTLVFSVFLFGAIGVLSIFMIIDDLKESKPILKILGLTLFSFSFSIYSFYYFLASYPKIIISKLGLEFKTIFKSSFFNWDEIKTISLTGKKPVRFLFISMPGEATTFKLKDNSEKVIFADYYRNISNLRVIIERAKKLLDSGKEIGPNLVFSIENSTHKNFSSRYSLTNQKFAGKPIKTFNGIVFYLTSAFCLFLVYKSFHDANGPWGGIGLASYIFLLLGGLLSYQMNYFILTDNTLIIKNHFWFWRKHYYPIDNIREVVFEMPHKLSTSMRVITKNFKTKLYPAGSLKDKTWKDLKEALENRKIEVRNEAYFS